MVRFTLTLTHICFHRLADVDCLFFNLGLQRIQQAEWIEKYRDLLGTNPIWDPEVIPSTERDGCEDDEADEVSLDSLRELLELGVGLPPHPVLEKCLAKLQGLLEMSEKIEDKAKLFLQARYDYTNLS